MHMGTYPEREPWECKGWPEAFLDIYLALQLSFPVLDRAVLARPEVRARHRVAEGVIALAGTVAFLRGLRTEQPLAHKLQPDSRGGTQQVEGLFI